MADIPITIGLETVTGDGGAKFAAIVQLLKELFEGLKAIAKEGDAAKDVFDQLRINLDAATKATQGEVTQLELATLANRAHMGGLRLTGEEYGRLAEFAKKAADSTGQEFGSVMQTVMQAMITGRTQALRPFIGDLELTGTTAEKQAQIMAALTGKIDEFAEGADTAGDAVARFETQMEDINTEFSIGVTESTKLVAAFDELARAMDVSGSSARSFGQIMGDMAADFLSGAAETIRNTRREIEAIYNFLESIGNGAAAAFSPEFRQRLNDARMTAYDAHPPSDGRESRGGQITGGGPYASMPDPRSARPRSGGGGGGGGGGRGVSDLGEMGTYLFGPGSTIEEMEAENLSPTRLANQWGDAVDAVAPAVKGYMNQLDMAQRKDAWFAERTLDNARKRTRARQEELDFAANMVGTMGSAFGQLAGILGASETAQHLIRGTTETVLAAIAWAKALEPGMQAYIPSAIAHTAAAAAAFAAAANPSGGRQSAGVPGGGGGGVSSGAGASFAGGGSWGGGGGGGRTTTITINMGPGVSSARDVRRAVQEALIQEADNGRPLPWRVVERRR